MPSETKAAHGLGNVVDGGRVVVMWNKGQGIHKYFLDDVNTMQSIANKHAIAFEKAV